jgi:hypothetical protein
LELIEKIAGQEVAVRYGQRLATLAGGLPVQIVAASNTMRREARRGRIESINLTLTQEAAQSFGVAIPTLLDDAMLHGGADEPDGEQQQPEEKVRGWESRKTLVSVTAYHSLFRAA